MVIIPICFSEKFNMNFKIRAANLQAYSYGYGRKTVITVFATGYINDEPEPPISVVYLLIRPQSVIKLTCLRGQLYLNPPDREVVGTIYSIYKGYAHRRV
jgi:hypothetical protein